MEGSHLMSLKVTIKEKALIMSLEATGPWVQHESFDVDEKISLLDFAGFSSLTTHGIPIRVIYSESVNKMLQHEILC